MRREGERRGRGSEEGWRRRSAGREEGGGGRGKGKESQEKEREADDRMEKRRMRMRRRERGGREEVETRRMRNRRNWGRKKRRKKRERREGSSMKHSHAFLGVSLLWADMKENHTGLRWRWFTGAILRALDCNELGTEVGS